MGNMVVSRNWRIIDGGKEHIIQLRHNNVSGRRVLIVNGEVFRTLVRAAKHAI